MYSWHTRKKGWIGAGLDPRQHAVVAEWLRRLTRNQFRSAGVGSNPTDREYFLVGAEFFYICIRVGPTAPTPCSKLVPVAIVFLLV